MECYVLFTIKKSTVCFLLPFQCYGSLLPLKSAH